MKNVIFDKRHLKNIFNMNHLEPREYWNISIASEREQGLVKMMPLSMFNLLKGAEKNDPWCECEVARVMLSFLDLIDKWKKLICINIVLLTSILRTK